MNAAQAHAARMMAHPRGRKEYPEAMRYVVIGVLILILFSLGSAAIYMLRGRGDSSQMAKALAWRVGLSVALFLLLMAGYFFGLFRPGQL